MNNSYLTIFECDSNRAGLDQTAVQTSMNVLTALYHVLIQTASVLMLKDLSTASVIMVSFRKTCLKMYVTVSFCDLQKMKQTKATIALKVSYTFFKVHGSIWKCLSTTYGNKPYPKMTCFLKLIVFRMWWQLLWSWMCISLQL